MVVVIYFVRLFKIVSKFIDKKVRYISNFTPNRQEIFNFGVEIRRIIRYVNKILELLNHFHLNAA